MKVILKGVQLVDFVDTESGRSIKGTKLHVVSVDQENTSRFTGYRTAQVFTNIKLPDLVIDSVYELVYFQPLGSNRSYLSEIIPSKI